MIEEQTAESGENTSGTAGEYSPSAEQVLQRVAETYLNSGSYNQSTADRTGDLMKIAHEIASDNARAKLVSVREPDTGIEGIAVLRPDGSIEALHDGVFDDYRGRPKHIDGTASMTRLESFVDHVNRFKDSHSAIFARDDMVAPSLTAVFDYHEDRIDGGGPRFGRHKSKFAFPLAPEWKAWTGQNKQAMRLNDFAEFIEDRFVDVEHITDTSILNDDIQKLVAMIGQNGIASPSDLVVLSRGLKVHVKDEVTDTRNIASGEIEVQFKSEHQDRNGNKLVVPGLFVLTIPIFKGGDLYRIAARLRYRVKEGALVFWYEMWGIERVFELAFSEACEIASTDTELPLFFGSPE